MKRIREIHSGLQHLPQAIICSRISSSNKQRKISDLCVELKNRFHWKMPVNGDTAISADKLSGIEEECDVYEGFAPHVDRTQITLLNDSPAGKQSSIK